MTVQDQSFGRHWFRSELQGLETTIDFGKSAAYARRFQLGEENAHSPWCIGIRFFYRWYSRRIGVFETVTLFALISLEINKVYWWSLLRIERWIDRRRQTARY